MKNEELFNYTNDVAEAFKSNCARFRDALDKVVPLINQEPSLYEKLSQQSQQLVLERIHLNYGFTDEIITTKILKDGTKITLNGCELLHLKSEMNDQIVKKIVQEHLNDESWEHSAKYVLEEFEIYMSDEQKAIMFPEKNVSKNKLK